MKDYSKAEKNNVQSDYNDSSTITDADIQAYQQNLNLVTFKQNKPIMRNMARSKIMSESRKFGKNNSSIMPSMTKSNYDNESMSFEVSERRDNLNISTKLHKMIDPGIMTNYNLGKFNNNSMLQASPNAGLKNSIEGSPERLAYQSVYSRDSKSKLRNMGPDMKRQSVGVPRVNNLNTEIMRPGTQNDMDARVRLMMHKILD